MEMSKINDNESDTEELFVFAEFKSDVNIEKYNSIHVLGIDTKRPIFQLDDDFFVGKFENPLGTFMFFEDDPFPQCEDPLFDKWPEKNLKYILKTRKCVSLEHGYLTPVEGTEDVNKKGDIKEPEEDNIKLIKFNNIQEALAKFIEDWPTNRDDK